MIECNDLIKIYLDNERNIRVPALRGIDLSIPKGELISIVGPSGSGKSTLINILAGIDGVSSGTVKVGEYQLDQMTDSELMTYRLETVGLVHQFPERTLFLDGTVMDNLIFASSLYTKNITEAKIDNKEILKKLDIDKLENRKVSYLSGGEMIRTAIACMLAKNAPVLFCDEPTGQLDSINTERVKILLREITRDYGTTIIVVTHDERFHEGVDKTCEIRSGRVSSLIAASEKIVYSDTSKFPLIFKGQVDTSHSVRIPDLIYEALQIRNDIEFIFKKNGIIEIKNPSGIPPLEVKLEDIKKQRRKTLTLESLPENYHKGKTTIIDINNASKVYESKGIEVTALRDISLKIHQGELVFIVGPSGSGKTTLMKLLTGLEPNTKGEIMVLTHKLHEMHDSERARFRRTNMGIVSQQGNLHPYLTVEENLYIKEIYSGKSVTLDDSHKEQNKSLFDSYNISQQSSSYPLEISGGELQRASLAIANFGSPEILLLDEPTANMDAELAESVMDQLFEFHDKAKTTLLITTHDITLVPDGNRLIELLDGTIKRDGLVLSEKPNKKK